MHSPVAIEAPLIDPATLLDDPYAGLGALRRAHSVVRFSDHQYVVLRAHDVLSLLTDPRTVQLEGSDFVRLQQVPEGVTARFLSDIFVLANGEDHRAKRVLFARAFSRRAIEDSQARMRDEARTIVDDLPRGEVFDFVDAMAGRVPAEMIASLLGLPIEEAKHFAPHVYQLARAVSPVYPIEEHDRIEGAAVELFNYLERHLQRRSVAPGDDLLSRLVREWKVDRAIDFESLVHQVLFMILAGSDTTRATFAMTVSLLLSRPDDWTALRTDPSLIAGAIAEGMRYEPSVGSIPRFTVAEIDIGPVRVPPGVMLGVSTLSAMRDPALYASPDRFDIRRTDHPRSHLVFGRGPHRCIGEHLARLEMEEGLAALLSAAPDIEMFEAPRMIGFGGIRQITSMPVCIH